MKFGKLPDITQVDFTLPPAPAGTSTILSKHPKAQAPKLYVGCTGWGMKEWVGKVYPEKAKAKDYLTHYTKQFNTIELNTTHYRIPSVETINKWKKAALPDFHFCPKIPQTISHSRDLGLSKGQIQAFCEVIQGLEMHLGCCFMQLPPYFGVDRISILEKFLDFFPNHIPLAIEVRHESWFLNQHNLSQLTSLLERKQVAFVITDVAGRRDVLHQRLTNGIALVRFVGNDLVPSDFSRIDEWVIRLKEWVEQGLQAAYFFTHEPDNLKAPELAQYLVEQAQKIIPSIQTRGPKWHEAGGGQMSLF